MQSFSVQLCNRCAEQARSWRASTNKVFLSPLQVDEKCVSCGHKGLSFYTMQVRLRLIALRNAALCRSALPLAAARLTHFQPPRPAAPIC